MRKITKPEQIGLAAAPRSQYKTINFKGGQSLFLVRAAHQRYTAPSTTTFSGGSMKIKFDRIEKTKTNPNQSGKTFPIIRVHGTALEGKNADQDWSTQFFLNNKELAEQVEAFNKGDVVDVTMKKNGNFWNPTAFTKSAVPEYRPVAPVQSSGGCHTTNPRLENLKTAVKILGPKPPDEEPFDYLANAAGIADMVQNYVDEKGAFQFGNDTSEGIPEVEEPEVE